MTPLTHRPATASHTMSAPGATSSCVKRVLLTLVFLQQKGQVLLGMKKRGFGAGKWNGFGGKLEPGESVKVAAARELHEEAGITVPELSRRAVLLFEMTDPADNALLEVHVYTADRIAQGTPVETEEMRPAWYSVDAVPLDSMWADDQYWLPQVLRGEMLTAWIVFGAHSDVQQVAITPCDDETALPAPLAMPRPASLASTAMWDTFCAQEPDTREVLLE